MQTHRRLMLLGGILLILTFLINDHHEQNRPDGGGDAFNYAYVTGVAMIAVFLASFYLFYSKTGRNPS